MTPTLLAELALPSGVPEVAATGFDLLAARSQMAMSLGFHIVFAVAGMAMPLLMVLAQARWMRSGDPLDRDLAMRWAKGTAILFAVGAVSGTVLSFELGLLWPTFMRHAGPLVGLPFAMEGVAFFLEAIFLGLWLYGWDRLAPRVHLMCGIGVAVSGAASGIFVMAVNAWMNAPAGFTLVAGELTDVSPWAAFASPAFPTQALHMLIAAYTSVGFAVAGIHAFGLRRRPGHAFHRRALRLALPLVVFGAPLMAVTGDLSAKHIAEHQPVKLAAAEALFETRSAAPLALGGWPDEEAQELRGALELPGALSFLAFGDPDAEVIGLDGTARSDWPPVAVVHVAFQIMVGCGSVMIGVALWVAWAWMRPVPLSSRPWLLGSLVLAGPLGLVALEAGWTVTEVGRQPWIVVGVLRVADAVTPMPGLGVPFLAFSALYLVLGVIVIVLLQAHVLRADAEQA